MPKPSSYRDATPPCCATCKHSGWKRGMMSPLCFLGEPEHIQNDNIPDDSDGCTLEGDALDRWWVERVVNELGICDQYEIGS